MISVENLSKHYGKTKAVTDLSFSLRPGKVTGFLGPNGSGKSTTMRCIVGLDNPASGRATIDGVDYSDSPAPLTKVGALLDGKAFHPKRTARQHLEIVATTHGLPKARVRDVLELAGITAVADKKLGGFSLGMGQRVGIATALIGDPEVLIFDEPINGLDPDGVRWVRDLMRNLAAEGRTIFVSSHLMSEMSMTADDLVIIGRGSLIDAGPVEHFTKSASHATVIVAGPQMQQIFDTLRAQGLDVQFNQPTETAPLGTFAVTGRTKAEIGNLLYSNNLEIHELSATYSTLEDVFMELTDSSVDYRMGGQA